MAIILPIILQLANEKKEIKLGDLTHTRDFNFVNNTACGFLTIANCDDTIGKEINIVSNFEILMADILNRIRKPRKMMCNSLQMSNASGQNTLLSKDFENQLIDYPNKRTFISTKQAKIFCIVKMRI